jgi:hypothetical protein
VIPISIGADGVESIARFDAEARNVTPAKSIFVRLSAESTKDIFVFNAPKDDQVYLAKYHPIPLVARKLSIWPEVLRQEYLIVLHDRIPPPDWYWRAVLWGRWQFLRRHETHSDRDNPSWAVPAVYDVVSDRRKHRTGDGRLIWCCLTKIEVMHFEIFEKKMGTLDIEKRPLRYSGLLDGGFPESRVRTPKREGEDANHERRQGYDRSVILVGEVANADVEEPKPSALHYDRAAENAATFFKGLILLAVLALMYAIGKCLGIVDSYPDPKNYHHPEQNPKNPSEALSRWSRWKRRIRHLRG